MANFNKVLLLGNLTRDPQLSYLPSQTAVVDFGLAVNRTWTSKEGNKKEETCFVDCRAFGKPAETIQKYCQKGKQLLVEGRLTYDTWTAQDGTKKSKLRVTVENFQFVGAPSGARPAAGAATHDQNNAPVDNEPGPQGFDDSGDEIPF
jgi:single-strand DNA-binding protein